jgi:hypothetical protein
LDGRIGQEIRREAASRTPYSSLFPKNETVIFKALRFVGGACDLQVADHGDDVRVAGVEFAFGQIDGHVWYSFYDFVVLMVSIVSAKSGRNFIEL